MERKMLAPIVIPMAGNMATFTNHAEKANQVSENKCQREMSKMECKQQEVLAKMTKEMNELKYVLSQIVPKKNKREAIKEQGRNSPQAKFMKVLLRDSTSSDEFSDYSGENIAPMRRAKTSVITKAERDADQRITNLHRRYSCQLRQEMLVKTNSTLSRNWKGR